MPPKFTAAVIAMLVALLLLQSLRLWAAASAPTRRARARGLRAVIKEREGERLLVARGFEIEALQPEVEFAVRVDGKPETVTVRADALVRRHGRRYVADIKSGSFAPSIQSAATRRQLIEYRLVYDVDGVLLVDMERGSVQKIDFDFEVRAEPRHAWAWSALVVVCLSVALGWALWN